MHVGPGVRVCSAVRRVLLMLLVFSVVTLIRLASRLLATVLVTGWRRPPGAAPPGSQSVRRFV